MSAQQRQPEMVSTMRNEDGAHETTAGSEAGTTSRSASGSGGQTLHSERDNDRNCLSPAKRQDAAHEKKQPRKSGEQGQTDKETKKTGLSKLEDKMPDWLSKAVRTPRMWKNFTRCMIATFATLILMLVQKSLNTLGQAAFFGLIVSQMLPPSMALSVYFFAFTTLVIGMCTGWAWGCAAMAAALRARSQTLLASAVQRETATYTQSTNLDAQYQSSIFHGAFLDPRSSTVFGVFLFIGAYACGFLRAKMPRLTLGAIFATIILDCEEPFLAEQAQYLERQEKEALTSSDVLLWPVVPDIPVHFGGQNNLLIPAACFLAIALASTILIFPQSLHSIVMTQVTENCLTPIKALLDLQEPILSASPSDREAWSGLAQKAYGLRKAHVMGVAGVDGQIKLLGLEVSRGRLSAVDLVRIVEKGKELGARAYSLASFVMILDERSKAINKLAETSDAHHRRRKQYIQNIADNQHPGTAIDDLLPLLATSTSSLRSASSDALADIMRYLDSVNHSRWGKLKGPSSDVRRESLARLQNALEQYKSSDAARLLEPFRNTFDSDGHLRSELIGKLRYSARDLFTCYLLTTGLTSFAKVLLELMELIVKLEEANPKNHWNFPTNMRKALSENAADKNGGNPLDMRREPSEETLVDPEEEKEKGGRKQGAQEQKAVKQKKQKNWDPDATDPRNAFQRFGRHLYALWRGLTGVNGIFALKYGIVTMALWTPQVIGSSAYFVYTNRGLWALIMAQTGMGVYTGEQIGSFFLRMGGTILGLIIGMVAWYIGAGHGPGNPYGVAASTMVFIAVPLFIRISAPMQSPPMITALMTGVTTTFVIGYSWVDEHIYQIANQGSGASLAGRRALLVIIGFTAAFIVMLFPKPTSARKIVRYALSRNLLEISNLYAAVIGGWEEEVEWADEDAEDGKKAVTKRTQRRLMYRERFTQILERMGSIAPQMNFAGIEPGLKGPWPKERYEELQALELQLVSALALLSGAYGAMEIPWAKRLESHSELMHPAFIADCLALFALLHQSLRNGHSLPSTMPIFERLGYHSQYRHHRNRNARREGDATAQDPSDEKAGSRHRATDDADASITPSQSSINVQLMEGEARLDKQESQVVKDLGSNFTFDTMKDEQFAYYAVANVALIHVTTCLNEIHLCVKQLVGERELVGFEQTQQRWARMEMTSV